MRLSVLFLLWPLAEIVLFVTVGGAIGVLATLAVILGTGILGVVLLRRMGVRRWPGDPLRAAASGGMTMLAALLMILPGFLTDALGLLLLLPPVQAQAAAWLGRRIVVHDGGARRGADVIDGEFIEVDPEDIVPRPTHRPPSGWTRH